MKNRTTVERKSDRELVVTRTFDAPAHIVFEAWTKPDLFKRWWVPKSFGLSLLSCEMDVRAGGTYRLVFSASPEPMAFFGRYIDVTPHSVISRPKIHKTVGPFLVGERCENGLSLRELNRLDHHAGQRLVCVV